MPSLRIAIQNPAPTGAEGTTWGDYHYGLSLQRALEKCGAEVTQHFWPWDEETDEPDLVFVLRGKRRYTPGVGNRTVMWVISHPSTVTKEEIETYDLVFVASETHRQMLEGASSTPVRLLRQCTDTTLFRSEDNAAKREGILFVANSRGVQRDMLRWFAELGLRPTLIGRGWNSVGLGHWVTQEYVENSELPKLYRSAALGLNDHWADMKHYGYISNRIFDCLACGLPVLSDDFPELREYCGDGLLYASDLATFRQALTVYQRNYPDLIGKTAELWKRIGPDHTFDAAAAEILATVSGLTAKTNRSRLIPETKASAMQDSFRAALVHLRRNGLDRPPKLLHVHPSEAMMNRLLTEPGYLSGGFGPGAWHLELPLAEPSIREERFDLILVEDSTGPEKESEQQWLISLAKRIRVQQGVIIFPFPEWDERLSPLADEGFVVADARKEWTILRRM